MDSAKKCKNVCRTCLKNTEKLVSVFEEIDVWGLNIAEMLKDCAAVEIAVSDTLPKVICEHCIQQVKVSYNFKQQCSISQQTLLVLYESRSQTNESETKQSDKFINDSKSLIKEEDLNEDSDDSSYREFLYFEDSKVEIEITSLDETTPKIEDSLSATTERVNSKDQENDDSLNEEATEINKCLDCDVIFKTKSAYNNHYREQHVTKKYCCEICNRGFLVGWALQNHMLTHGFHCQTCFKSFESEADLETHKVEHKDQNGFLCKDCGKHFIKKAKLRLHMRTHTGEKPHLCTVCGKAFALGGNLNAHMRIHTGVKPYTCNLCNDKFVQWHSLRSHLVTHVKEKVFMCTICGKGFSRKQVLKQHAVSHTDERKYPCQLCEKRFKNKRDRTLHLVVHTGEKKHTCVHCGKSFNRASNLKVHNRIHTGERPHTCSTCGRGFIQLHVLNNHMKTHQLK